jgi:putative sugar O-methyltransferase
MRLQLKHLRHPLRTANLARAVAAARWNDWRFAERGDQHFAGDARYDLRSVAEGFADRVDEQSGDASLLERICAAYTKAVAQEQFAPEAYRATGWWEQRRKLSLEPIIRALMTGDIAAVRRMYRNFYRDRYSAGLTIDQRLPRDYFGARAKDFHRRLYLIDALYRIDYWKAQTGGSFSLKDLSGPAVGNPFGVVLEGTLVRVGAEYQHYCAHRIGGLLGSKASTVVEIGGGFGGMAYYLLRDRPGTTYIAFDVPESIALTTYYLSKAFPDLRVLLYGEGDLTKETLTVADVLLMPVFELAAMPAACADVTFTSHAMTDLSPDALAGYLNDVARMTRDDFLCIGNGPSGRAMADVVNRKHPSLKLTEMLPSGWHDHKTRGIDEIECLYRRGT